MNGVKDKSWLRGGLFAKYVISLVGLVVFVLAVNGVMETWIGYRATRTSLTTGMADKAEATARRIEQAMSDLERQTSWVTRASANQFTTEQRRADYTQLLNQVPAVSQFVMPVAIGVFVLNGQSASPGKLVVRLVVPACVFQRQAVRKMRGGVFRGKTSRLCKLGQGVGNVSKMGQCQSEVVACGEGFGRVFNGITVIRDRGRVISLLDEHIPDADESFRVMRVHPQRSEIPGLRLIAATHAVEHDTDVVVRLRLGLDRNRILIFLDRFLVTILSEQLHSELRVGDVIVSGHL